MRWTAIDVETTGGSRQDRIIQIGLAVYCDGHLISRWGMCLQPDPWKGSDKYALEKHQIPEARLRKSPKWGRQVWRRLQPYLTGMPVVAHNISAEKRFLTYELGHLLGLQAAQMDTLSAGDWGRLATRANEEKQLELPVDIDWRCTAGMARDLFALSKMPSLEQSCQVAGVSYDGGQHHDALWDAQTCGAVFGQLYLQSQKQREIKT